MNLKSHRWPTIARSAALSAVAAAVMGLAANQSWALSLGPVVVQSALGEPLRAEIDILDISADEAASLKTGIASPEVFKAAGLDYNAAMTGMRVSLARRSNGRAYISLQSDRPVNDPFVDMILETSWASGRIVRDYTLLFDPPNLRTPPAPAAAAQAALPMGTTAPAMVAAPVSSSAGTAGRATSRAAAASKAAARPAPANVAGEGQLTVKQGDTASKIAMVTKPANISLDQMLVALLRANPDAFIQGNLNRLKSGAVLTVPTAEQAAAVNARDASQTVVAQSRDFGDFRKKLASAAPSAQVAAASRESGGNVQAKVDDKKPSASAPDKLTLSKGAVATQANAEKVAKDLAAKEAAARTAEVSKNIADLAKIGAASAPAGSSGAAAPATAAPPPSQPPVIAMPAQTPPASAATPATPGTSATVAAARPNAKAPPPLPEPTLVDQLIDNPMVPAAGAGLVALLAVFGLYRARLRKKVSKADDAFLESRLQPDSFFGSTGGQRVDTSETGAGSSMVYTPSQLDAADDVDPVAEADVYLAYGRDVQAEEILKEALKTNPGRIAIHQKLLEIYGKRRDTRSFELTANEAYKVTNGEGADWARICDQGLAIDPSNQLYQPGGTPVAAIDTPSQSMPLDMQKTPAAVSAVAAGLAPAAMAAAAGAAAAGMATVSLSGNSAYSAGAAPAPARAAVSTPVDLDFDLDFSLDDANAGVISDMSTSEQTSKMAAVDSGSVPLDMNFDLPGGPATEVMPPQAVAAPPAPPDTKPGVIEFDMPADFGLSNSGEISRPVPLEAPSNDPAPLEMEEFKKEAAVSFGATIAGPLASFAAKPAEAAAKLPDVMNFDLGSLSLDLDDPKPAAASAAPVAQPVETDDPLATKLALAEEFSSIGDTDGARSMIEEVIAEATGDVKARAQQVLARLA